jgi:hypothetical protein
MAGVGAADASGEIDVAVTIDVLEPGVFGLGYVDRRAVGEAARDGLRASLGERAGVGAGDWGGDSDCGQFNFSGELPEAVWRFGKCRGPSTAVVLRAWGAKINPRSG